MVVEYAKKRIQDVSSGTIVCIEDPDCKNTESMLEQLYIVNDDSYIFDSVMKDEFANKVLVTNVIAGEIFTIPFDTMVTPVDARLQVNI